MEDLRAVLVKHGFRFKNNSDRILFPIPIC